MEEGLPRSGGRKREQMEELDHSGCTLSSFDSGSMKILYIETDSGYTAQMDLEFLSSSDPPASGTITKVGGGGSGDSQQAPGDINVYQRWNDTAGLYDVTKTQSLQVGYTASGQKRLQRNLTFTQSHQ